MSQVLHLCMVIAERAVQVQPSCRRRRSFSAWWGRWKPRLSMQFSLMLGSPTPLSTRSPKARRALPKELNLGNNKNMKIYENRVSACVPKETAHHHATSGTLHVDSCIRCIWRSYQPARAVHVHLCPWSFSSFWSSNMGGKCQRHPRCCVRQAQAEIFDMIIEVEKTNCDAI